MDAASTWQVQLVGKKRWTLCPNTESRYLDPHLDTYNPDYEKFPHFAKAQCGQVTVSPGELLYYPAYWWHHTLQLETPSISYTGALVGVEADRFDLGGDRKPHMRFYADLQQKCAKCWSKGVKERQCDDISTKWAGAAPPPLRVVCLHLWSEHAKALHGADQKSELTKDSHILAGFLRIMEFHLKSVIFDLDGVLVDTEGATCQWIDQLLEPHGLQWTRELHRHIAGTVKFFPHRCLELLEVSPQRKAELVEVLPSRLTSPEYSTFVAERMEIKAGAVGLIKRLQSLQIPLALCTSRRGDGLKALMDLRPDLADLLEPLKVQVVGAIDPRTGVQVKGKPDPQAESST
eukprot:symbB.v1.2.029114.t1/scaffold3154.1/size62266/2